MLRPFEVIRFGRLDFLLEAMEPIPLQGFCGPTLRGTLGHALFESSCLPDKEPAYSGPNLYRDLFEGPTPPPGGQDQAPPFVLHPPLESVSRLQPGDQLSFGLSIFGDVALEQVPALLWSFFRYGLHAGLSRERRRYLLTEVKAFTPSGPLTLFRHDGGPVPQRWDPQWTWNAGELLGRRLEQMTTQPRELEIKLLTPLDIREKKRPVPVIRFQHILRSLLRNASAHARHHCGNPIDLDFRALKETSAEVETVWDKSDWLRVSRDSSRQERTIPVQTRIGSLRFSGELEPFLPLLLLGEYIHVGKGRTMGFGEVGIRIE